MLAEIVNRHVRVVRHADASCEPMAEGHFSGTFDSDTAGCRRKSLFFNNTLHPPVIHRRQNSP
jgi:hypothetical protein